jgi:hypothetical protein
MFGLRQPANLATVDAAFDQAEANAREFGKIVAGQIATRYRAGAINRGGIDQLVELALEQTASKAQGVPRSMLKSILATLHRTIRTELAAAGIAIPELQA